MWANAPAKGPVPFEGKGVAPVRTICVQVQPKQSPGLDIEAVARLMLQVAIGLNTPRFTVVRGRKNAWINFLFEAKALRPVWSELQSGALRDRRLGAALRQSAIVTAEGSRGWDNYRLLHHFDDREHLDRI